VDYTHRKAALPPSVKPEVSAVLLFVRCLFGLCVKVVIGEGKVFLVVYSVIGGTLFQPCNHASHIKPLRNKRKPADELPVIIQSFTPRSSHLYIAGRRGLVFVVGFERGYGGISAFLLFR